MKTLHQSILELKLIELKAPKQHAIDTQESHWMENDASSLLHDVDSTIVEQPRSIPKPAVTVSTLIVKQTPTGFSLQTPTGHHTLLDGDIIQLDTIVLSVTLKTIAKSTPDIPSSASHTHALSSPQKLSFDLNPRDRTPNIFNTPQREHTSTRDPLGFLYGSHAPSAPSSAVDSLSQTFSQPTLSEGKILKELGIDQTQNSRLISEQYDMTVKPLDEKSPLDMLDEFLDEQPITETVEHHKPNHNITPITPALPPPGEQSGGGLKSHLKSIIHFIIN